MPEEDLDEITRAAESIPADIHEARESVEERWIPHIHIPTYSFLFLIIVSRLERSHTVITPHQS